MEIKGHAVLSVPKFVEATFAARRTEWLDALSPSAREIMEQPILPSSWYPLEAAFTEPTRKLCDVFFDGRDAGAFEAGRFAASYSLTGLYKMFVKLGSPAFLISRASLVMNQYYRPIETVVDDRFDFKKSKRIAFQIKRFDAPNWLLDVRVAGFCQRALEISGCNDVEAKIAQSLAKGDAMSEFVLSWS